VPQTGSRFEIGLLYLGGVVQGLALVTFPAASTIFTSPTGFALSNTQYGAMFIPQVVLAILASAFGSAAETTRRAAAGVVRRPDRHGVARG
jgi:MFS transporter, FHS family, glucose/mannose:H+ symporter